MDSRLTDADLDGSRLLAEWRAQSQAAIRQYIDECAYLVEADGFAVMSLWADWHKRVPWEQLNPGFGEEIGRLARKPVCASVAFNRIGGHVVGFYEATSRVVDWQMVEDWTKRTFKRSRGKVDAMNFHNCIHALGVPVASRNSNV